MQHFNRKLVLLHLVVSVVAAGSGVSPIQSGIKREGSFRGEPLPAATKSRHACPEHCRKDGTPTTNSKSLFYLCKFVFFLAK